MQYTYWCGAQILTWVVLSTYHQFFFVLFYYLNGELQTESKGGTDNILSHKPNTPYSANPQC